MLTTRFIKVNSGFAFLKQCYVKLGDTEIFTICAKTGRISRMSCDKKVRKKRKTFVDIIKKKAN